MSGRASAPLDSMVILVLLPFSRFFECHHGIPQIRIHLDHQWDYHLLSHSHNFLHKGWHLVDYGLATWRIIKRNHVNNFLLGK